MDTKSVRFITPVGQTGPPLETPQRDAWAPHVEYVSGTPMSDRARRLADKLYPGAAKPAGPPAAAANNAGTAPPREQNPPVVYPVAVRQVRRSILSLFGIALLFITPVGRVLVDAVYAELTTTLSRVLSFAITAYVASHVYAVVTNVRALRGQTPVPKSAEHAVPSPAKKVYPPTPHPQAGPPLSPLPAHLSPYVPSVSPSPAPRLGAMLSPQWAPASPVHSPFGRPAPRSQPVTAWSPRRALGQSDESPLRRVVS